MIPLFISKIFKKHSLFNLPHKDVFMVFGAPRNGTSLIMEILKECGVFVGNPEDLKKPDEGNPRGYFEHIEEHKLSNVLLRQAGYRPDMSLEKFSLGVKGILRKARRLITRFRMNKFLKKIYTQSDNSFALKVHFLTFPLWQAHIPDFKIVIIYRHPVISAHSNIKLKNFTTLFYTNILKWERAYREYIYYYGRYPSIVISYEDLVDSEKCNRVLQQLINFIGRGKLENLREIISPKLNRSFAEIKKLTDVYPLPQSVKEMLEALERIKV